MFSPYFDEDSSAHSLLVALCSSGFDCLTVREADQLKRSDEEQLEYATSQHRVLYSANAGDFARLHSQWLQDGKSHAGIIVVSERCTQAGVQLRALRALAEIFGPDDMADRLEYLLNYTP